MSLKEKLMKTRYGIPALALILVIVLSATAIGAGYLVYEDTDTVGVEETIEVEKLDQAFEGDLQPGYRMGDHLDDDTFYQPQYIVTNTGASDLTITVRWNVDGDRSIDDVFDEYGMRIVPCEHDTEIAGDMNFEDTWVWWEPGDESFREATFTIGTEEFDAGTDTKQAWVYVEGIVKDDIDPEVDVDISVEIFRG